MGSTHSPLRQIISLNSAFAFNVLGFTVWPSLLRLNERLLVSVVGPVTLRLKSNDIFLLIMLLGIASIFCSYVPPNNPEVLASIFIKQLEPFFRTFPEHKSRDTLNGLLSCFLKLF